MTVGSATSAATPSVPEADAPTTASDPEHWQARLETFVGREREMQILRARIDDAIEGKGSLVLVSGEPGIGKTRLLTEASRYAESKNVNVMWGRCWDGGGAPAFWPWIQALRASHDEASRSEALFTSCPDADNQPIASVVGRHISDETQFQLFDTISGILRVSAQKRPLLLLFDDLHNADPSSIRALEFLSTELRQNRYAIIATVRTISNPSQLQPYLRRLSNDPLTTSVALHGLDGSALKEFLSNQLPLISISQVDLRRIRHRTEGNPFFLLEVCQSIREARQVNLPTAMEVPASVASLLDNRLAGLPEDCTQFLYAASVAGRTFSGGLIARLLKKPDEQERMSYLAESRGIIARSGREAAEFQFSHAIFREAFYSRLTLNDRLRLHAQIADRIEQEHEAQPADGAIDALAHHYRQARHFGKPGKALFYTLRAAAAAQIRAAHDHAVYLLQEALCLTEEGDSSRLDILLRLGNALCSAGRWQESRSTFLEASQLAKSHSRDDKFAEAAIGFKGLILSPAPPDQQSIDLLQEARSRLPAGETRLKVRLLHALATATHFSPPAANLSSLASDALELAESEHDVSSKAIALESMIVAHWRPGNARGVIQYAQELLDIGRRLRDDELVAKSHIHLYLARAQNLETDASRELDLAERWATSANHPKLRWQVSLLRSSLAIARAQLSSGLRHAHVAGELGKRCHDETAFLHLGLNLLLRARLIGRFDDSEEAIRAGARLTTDIPLSKLATDCIDFAFDPAPRLRALNETLRSSTDYLHTNAFSLWAQCILAELALLTGNRDVSEAMTGHLECYSDEAVVAGWGTAIEGATTHFLGLCFLSLGNFTRALECLRAAVDTNGDCNWPLLRARSELFLALGLQLDGSRRFESEAIRLVDRARATYSQAGVDPTRNPFLSIPPGILLKDASVCARPSSPPSERLRRRPCLTAVDGGELVSLRYGDDSVQLKKTKAMRQLVWLILNPGSEIPAVMLAQIDRDDSTIKADRYPEGEVSGSRMPVIDDQARATYSKRVRELRELLDAPSNDPATVIELKEELQWLSDVLAKASALGGKTRLVSDPDERARISVRNNISNAINRIRRQNSRIGAHLFNSIHTGTVCCYRPEDY